MSPRIDQSTNRLTANWILLRRIRTRRIWMPHREIRFSITLINRSILFLHGYKVCQRSKSCFTRILQFSSSVHGIWNCRISETYLNVSWLSVILFTWFLGLLRCVELCTCPALSTFCQYKSSDWLPEPPPKWPELLSGWALNFTHHSLTVCE